MQLLGIDIGTTHIKAGLFKYDGELVRLAIEPNKSHIDRSGHSYYDPVEMWDTVSRTIRNVTNDQDIEIGSIGITSMAESGLLLDPYKGEYRSIIIPWFDRRTQEVAEIIQNESNPFEQFQKTGLRNSYKYGLAKLLWLKRQDPDMIKNAKWFSISDFIAYKLTGNAATDYTLAARTFAFRIDRKEWDVPWLRHFGLNKSLLPEAKPSGVKIGEIQSNDFNEIGLKKGIPVAIAGHDHVCAALAVGAVEQGTVSDSIGTAETLVGPLNELSLYRKEFDSGFSFGCHVLQNRYFWMGAIQSSGGSVEWLRNLFSNEHLTYEEVERLLNVTTRKPTGILYYPYLSGSGSPFPDFQAKGAFIGLKSNHKLGDLLKALLEGTSYELKLMKRTIEKLQQCEIARLIAVGGGTKNHHWMQIKADVTKCLLSIPYVSEASLLGAALTAGLGCGIYKDEEEVIRLVSKIKVNEIYPDLERHEQYRKVFEEGYLPLQQPLRKFYKKNL